MASAGRSRTNEVGVGWGPGALRPASGLLWPLQEGMQGNTQPLIGQVRSEGTFICAGESLEGFKWRKNLIRPLFKRLTQLLTTAGRTDGDSRARGAQERLWPLSRR